MENVSEKINAVIYYWRKGRDISEYIKELDGEDFEDLKRFFNDYSHYEKMVSNELKRLEQEFDQIEQ